LISLLSLDPDGGFELLRDPPDQLELF